MLICMLINTLCKLALGCMLGKHRCISAFAAYVGAQKHTDIDIQRHMYSQTDELI